MFATNGHCYGSLPERASGMKGVDTVKHESHSSHEISMDLEDVAYIRLPAFKEGATISKTISLRDLVENYSGGTDVELDFSAEGVLMGIEILVL